MQGKILGVCLGVLFLSVWVTSALAAERWVAGNGTNLDGANDCLQESFPCKTITQALTRANPRDKITVKGGSYKCEESFPIVVDKSLKIEASSKATVDATACEPKVIVKIEASNTSFINFKIKGGKIGIQVEGALFVTIQKVTLESVDVGIWLLESSDIIVGGSQEDKNEIKKPNNEGIKLERSDSNIINYNEITEASSGIALEESDDNKLIQNIIKNSSKEGITIINSNKNDIATNNVIQSDQESPAGTHGIAVVARPSDAEPSVESQGNTLVGNTISGYTTGIFLESTQTGSFKNVVLQGNVVQANGTGISLDGIFDNTVLAENTVSNNTAGDGISFMLQEGRGNRIINNIISLNGGYGLFFKDSAAGNQDLNITIFGNTVTKNARTGIRLEGSFGNIVSANTVQGNGEAGIALKNGSDNTITDNDVRFHSEVSSTGISSESSYDNRLLNNWVEENSIGISLENSHSHWIAGNTVEKNKCNGIELQDSSNNQVQNNTVALNGKDSKCPDGQLLSGGTVLKGESVQNSIAGNTIQKNQNGIVVRDSSTDNVFECNGILENIKTGFLLISAADEVTGNSIHSNSIVGNSEFGLRNFTNETTDARFNWWGSPLGPKHPNNPQAEESADGILGLVDFTPWLESPIDLETCSGS